MTGAIRWKCRAEPREKYSSGIDSSPIVDADTVYVGSGANHLLALDLLTGMLKWRFRAGKTVNTTPAVYGDLVYFGSTDGFVYAVNKSTGRP